MEQYFEGLGCSPDEATVCAAASRARFHDELRQAAAAIDAGCILAGDPDERERRRLAEEFAGA